MTADPKVAVKAVANFKRMIPSLEGFATALAGKPLRIAPSSDGTYSDGRTLHIRPPYTLGTDEVPHTRSLCGTRDTEGFALCPACERRERIVSLVYHEMSHIIFGSFETVDHGKIKRGLLHADLKQEAENIDHHLRVTTGKADAQSVAAAIFGGSAPFSVVNALEDSRVDALMSEARPGTHEMTLATRKQVMDEVEWIKYPLDAQACVAPLLAVENFEYENYLHEWVAFAVSDPKIDKIIREIYAAISVDDSIVIAARYVDAMKDFGFFGGRPEPEEEMPGEGEPSEDSEEGEGDADETNDSSDEDNAPGESKDSDDGVQSESPAEDSEAGGDPQDGDGSGEEDPDSGPDGGEGADERDGEGSGDSDSPNDGGDEDAAGGLGEAGRTEAEVEELPSDDDAGPDALSGDGSSTEPDDGSDTGEGSEVGELEPDGDEGSDELDFDNDGDVSRPERPEPEEFEGDPWDAGREAQELLEKLVGHSGPEMGEDTRDERRMVESVIGTSDHFDTPSRQLSSVNVAKPESTSRKKIEISETILGPALLHLRKALENNQRASFDRNRKSGRIAASTLGKRAWNDDPRLFHKKVIPGKRDYAVVIGVDISGSTAWSSTLSVELKAAHAQAELCARVGIKFAVFAHTGSVDGLEITVVKEFNEPWNDKTQRRLAALRSGSANYDGHTLEFYRKALDRVAATDKILMYYSDGAMPAENFNEELALLKKEIRTCRQRGYVLMGVGIGSSDPAKYGMDTVRIDRADEVIKVVRHLGKRLEQA